MSPKTVHGTKPISFVYILLSARIFVKQKFLPSETKDMKATVEFYEKFGFCVAFEIVKSGKEHAEFE